MTLLVVACESKFVEAPPENVQFSEGQLQDRIDLMSEEDKKIDAVLEKVVLLDSVVSAASPQLAEKLGIKKNFDLMFYELRKVIPSGRSGKEMARRVTIDLGRSWGGCDPVVVELKSTKDALAMSLGLCSGDSSVKLLETFYFALRGSEVLLKINEKNLELLLEEEIKDDMLGTRYVCQSTDQEVNKELCFSSSLVVP